MNRVATSVMAEAGSESRQLIKTTISSLNDRLQTLESEAQDREEQLQEKNNEWKAYQVTWERLNNVVLLLKTSFYETF